MATTTKKPAAKKATTTKKTTTAKPAAKKTAAAKPAAKKTTTAKPVAKKTTATKTAVAKTTTAVKSNEISVNGNKKIATLCKEFNKKFPYLCLAIFYSYGRNYSNFSSELEKARIDGAKTIASVRRADSGGDISISGNKKIKSLEKEFDKTFGLYCQVGYTTTSGSRIYTKYTDDITLARLNAMCEKDGDKKGVWW